MTSLEDFNIANDERSRGPAKTPVLTFYGCGTCGGVSEQCDCPDAPDGVDPVRGTHFFGTDIEEKLPTTWESCPVCHGEGKHVNPAIDAGGLTAADFHEDPDFAAEYMRGTYDVTCNRCCGRTTVKGVDWDALTDQQRKLYEEQLVADAEYRAERLAEIRAWC